MKSRGPADLPRPIETDHVTGQALVALDADVLMAIGARRQDPAETPNDVLRRLLVKEGDPR